MSHVSENKVVSAPVPMTPLQEFWHYLNATGAVVGLVYVAIMIPDCGVCELPRTL